MIKINLLGEETQEDNTPQLLIGAYLASLAACIFVFYLLQSSMSTSNEELNSQVQSLEVQLNKLKETTKEVHELEKKREELRNKLTVIATLKRNKIGPVRVLDDLNASIPERSWLTEIREREGMLRINGIALDNQTVSTFAKGLATSDYYQTVGLVESKNVQYKGATVKEFTLQAKVNYAGKIVVQPTPQPGGGVELPQTGPKGTGG